MESFNALPAERLKSELLACLAAPAWGAEVAAKRPYRDRAELFAAADAAAAGLSWDDVLLGLSAHPRIGERAAGASKEAAWSRAEQSAAAASTDKSELIEANRLYEDKFGYVFLIFASGRSQAEILAAARERLGNDPLAERAVVQGELRKIALLRLERVLDAL
ncbi:2-oxo-4-hydroxy-4-carboxy-5-ureidoimidazoline decarboxylase [Actinoplanes lutulentus]|uniref:2-oxo-4-hydroxy-4-carboxy-5-ureidoimidazoline decarboxylase n=1 Tax=Actinoplanes lutulentus TaxID=1287878 RepID=A0A327ZLR3_9ACTN|nr:2-oxo-4-hydroxy-4-carboxy-5-ureidoimidazoline decarboxylase [Actinoplanes lutulentus]MBB2942828.1 2-oxo-4-hydroxy-4-carboxy-5-ureidoimidazoline decarboxylase [Actinoplanes lutulentus]RAK38407.1 2-oxo-4-hydroxy-4-carboxy-5-ureidoimidazoline decarboxylase [Actinoplanes lutulentus]